MSVLTTLLSNINKVRFCSLFPTDKIVYEDTYSQSLATGSSVTVPIVNPYGRKCFITLAWSVDNVNFYPAEGYTAVSQPYTANAWVSDSTIYIYLTNSSGGTVTFYTRFALDSIV